MRGKLRFCVTLLFILFFHIVAVSVVDATIRIMPLGDSITRGSSSGVVPNDPAHYVSYRKALWEKLEVAGYVIDLVGSQIAGSAIPDFDPDHEGHGGWRDDEILNGRTSEPEKGKLIEWLINHQPDIVLVHIGTNGVQPSPDDVEAILDVIDYYSVDVWVVLARIINRSCITNDPPCPESFTTTMFNNNITAMAQNRIDNVGDKIVLVDMENETGIDYRAFPAGDMWDDLHPFETGYSKMADLWFTALDQILPSVDGTNVVLDYIEIEGPPFVNENSRADYNCRAYYTNGTNRLVMADTWQEDSPIAEISNMGYLTTQEVSADELVEIFASYTEGAITTNTTYDIIVKNLNSIKYLVHGDLNGDGNADIAGIDTAGSAWYTTDLSTWTQIPGRTLAKIVTGDLDGDGDDDIVGVDALGRISYSTDLSSWVNIRGRLVEIVTGDLDGDSDDDIVGVNATGKVWYTTNLGTIWMQIPGRTLAKIATGDLNGDGNDDIVGVEASGNIWYTANLSTWMSIRGKLVELVTGDLDGDSDDDLAGVNATGKVWYTTNLGTIWTDIPGGTLAQIATGDVNGDGNDDLVGVDASGRISYSIDLSSWINISGKLVEIATVDLDGDGDDDLAGVSAIGRVWYTENLSTWINIPLP